MAISLCHSDIMDMRPTSRFTDEIAEEYWDKFVLGTYPKHNISEEWENFIQEFFKVCHKKSFLICLSSLLILSIDVKKQPKDSLEEWTKAWRELHEKADGNKKDLVDVIYNILGP